VVLREDAQRGVEQDERRRRSVRKQALGIRAA
jgi:hypothetical protein